MHYNRFVACRSTLACSGVFLLFVVSLVITSGCSGPQSQPREAGSQLSDSVPQANQANQNQLEDDCTDNLLDPTTLLYPDGVPQGGTLRLKGDLVLGFAPLSYHSLSFSHIYRLVQLPLAEQRSQRHESRLADCIYLDTKTNAVVVHLRPDLFWHPLPPSRGDDEPHPFTSSDLVFTAELYSNNTRGSLVPSRGRWDGVTAKVLDERTASFRVPTDDRKWKSLSRIVPLPEWYYGPGPNAESIPVEQLKSRGLPNKDLPGNGPYRVTSHAPGELILQRFPEYRGEAPTFDQIAVLGGFAHLDLATQFEREVYDIRRLKTADLIEDEVLVNSDAFDASPASDGATEQERIGVTTVPGSTIVAFWNLDHPLLGNPAHRTAMAHLLDRDRMVSGPLKNAGFPAYGLIAQNSEYFDEEFEPYPFSPEITLRILNENGWKDTDGDGILDKDGQPFAFQLEVESRVQWFTPALQQFIDEAANIGVEIEVVQLASEESYQAMSTAGGRVSSHLGFDWHVVTQMHSEVSYRAPWFPISPGLDALADSINSARESLEATYPKDEEPEKGGLELELKKQIQRAQNLSHQKQFFTPVFTGLDALAWNPGLRHHPDFNFEKDGLNPLQWYWLEPPETRPELPDRVYEKPSLPTPPNQVQRLPGADSKEG